MEDLRTFLWVVNFLFFSLILIFLWSKVVIVNKRLRAVKRLLAIGEEIDRERKRLGEKKKKKG
jgi:hypothetical protein